MPEEFAHLLICPWAIVDGQLHLVLKSHVLAKNAKHISITPKMIALVGDILVTKYVDKVNKEAKIRNQYN